MAETVETSGWPQSPSEAQETPQRRRREEAQETQEEVIELRAGEGGEAVEHAEDEDRSSDYGHVPASESRRRTQGKGKAAVRCNSSIAIDVETGGEGKVNLCGTVNTLFIIFVRRLNRCILVRSSPRFGRAL